MGKRYFAIVPYVLIGMQLVACISLLLGMKADVTKKWMFTNKDELKVSSKENVLVLVLDCFSNEVIPQLERDYPESLESLKDFVYFDNANSVYEATYMSLTYILTGMEYDTTCSYLDWGDRAWGSEHCKDIYDKFAEKNYKVRIYTTGLLECRNAENIGEKIDNYEQMEVLRNKIHYLNLTKIFVRSSLYKYMPVGLKEYFDITEDMFNANVAPVYATPYEASSESNADYYAALVNEGLTPDNTEEKYFIMEHLRGLHPSYCIDEKGAYVEDGDRISAARGCMLIVDEYITQLKNLGVYDNSTIIIMSDHGNQGQCEGVQPIFFIKEKNRTSAEMEVCSSPISYEDVMPTILKEIGSPNGEKTVFDYNNVENRERRMYIRGYDDRIGPVERSISGGEASLNVLYKYTYTGNEEALIEQEKAGRYEVIPLSEYPE